jgi:hypothetical protein
MDDDGIRAYVNRDWALLRRLKDAYWAEFRRLHGPIEMFRIAEELRRQAVVMIPGWPTERDRAEDLAHHIRLAELLRRASAPRGG